ncbi:MAG: four helix bundle protein [Phycisphaerae bacterium]|nr:four helix bundle protein [Phycisphaerae bacterium]
MPQSLGRGGNAPSIRARPRGRPEPSIIARRILPRAWTTRAVLSAAANLAKGNGRFAKADGRNFFTIARGSVHECVPLLEPAR